MYYVGCSGNTTSAAHCNLTRKEEDDHDDQNSFSREDDKDWDPCDYFWTLLMQVTFIYFVPNNFAGHVVFGEYLMHFFIFHIIFCCQPKEMSIREMPWEEGMHVRTFWHVPNII